MTATSHRKSNLVSRLFGRRNRGRRRDSSRLAIRHPFEALENRLLLVTFVPTKDTTLYETTDGSLGNGSGVNLYAGTINRPTNNLRRTLVHFDVSFFPAGSTVTDARLDLAVTRNPPGAPPHNFSLHKLNANWGEGLSQAPGAGGRGTTAETNDATWLHTFSNTGTWTNAGGDFAAAPSATTAVGNNGSLASWTSAQLIADVQAWVDDPTSNFGWILLGEESTLRSARRFASKEAPSGLGPILDVTIAPVGPAVSIAVNTPTVPELDGEATFTISLSEGIPDDITVGLGFANGTATFGDDYAVSATQVIIPAGDTQASITIATEDDLLDEPDETIIVDIASVSAGAMEVGNQQATTTITDDDEPAGRTTTLSIDNATIAEAGGGATVTATLSTPATQDIVVDLAYSGDATTNVDYDVSSMQIMIAAGTTTGSVTITATDDAVDEPDETVVIDIVNVSVGASENGQQQVVTTITDDDAPVLSTVTLSIDNTSLAEAGGNATITATLSAASTADAIVELGFAGDAMPTVDYNTSATQIVIATGSTTGSLTITSVDDALDEADETVVVDIANVVGGTEEGQQQVTTTIIDDDTPSFRVASLDPTDSGFKIEFNGQLDGSAINLYDTVSAGLGAADVVVTGASSGTVAGSLVIGETSVEFIKSGDAMAVDTYTVMLRSAPDGFKDTAGVQLDGDTDGTPGGDYSSDFTVDDAPPGSRTVSIPDFVRGPGQDVNLPANETTGIPISISDGANVQAADIQISYDPALLQITGATAPAGGTVTVNTTTPGVAVLAYLGAAPLPAGPGDLINLQATVPTADASAIYRSLQVLDVQDVVLRDGNDNALPVNVDDAFHFVTFYSDTSGNGRINASDASRVARFAALLDNGFAASLNADPFVLGDISGNGRINAADASRVASFAALFPVDEIPPLPGGVVIAGVFIAPPPSEDFGSSAQLVDAAAPTESAADGLAFQEYSNTLGLPPDDRDAAADDTATRGKSVLEDLDNELLDDSLVQELALDLFEASGPE